MGALPETLPGYVKADSELGHQRSPGSGARSPTSRARSSPKSWTGCAREHPGGYIMGENPMQSDPDAAKVEAGLRNLDFLIVQDIS